MGLGHVPQDPLRAEGEGAEFQGRERRGTSVGRNSRPDRPLSPSRASGTATEKEKAAQRNARGRWAEDLVAAWYVRQGFEIVARNWRCARGELDVVARRGSLLVVCEVKARADDRWGTALEAVSPRKQTRVRRASVEMLGAIGLRGVRVRFDVAAVTGTRLEVLADAF